MQDMQDLVAKLQADTTKLKAEQSLTDAIFASIGDGVIATDEHGKIMRVNAVALDMLGFEEDELLGKWYPDTVVAVEENGTPINVLDRPITSAFVMGRSISAKLFYQRRNGTILPVIITVSPIMLNGKPKGAIEIFRDYSKELQLERMKDDFISLVSHQLRTPATAVKQYIGMLLEGYAGKIVGEQRHFLKSAYSSNERQLAIVEDMLNVTKLESGKIQLFRQDIDLCSLVDKIAAEQLRTLEERGQELVIHKDNKQIIAYADPVWLRMVIENLLSNASKYTPHNKSITITVKDSARSTIVMVSDQGVGIAGKDQKQLFLKFSRIKNDLSEHVSGSGLGLYLAKKIIDLHNGRINVKSSLQKGSTFAIQLPHKKEAVTL